MQSHRSPQNADLCGMRGFTVVELLVAVAISLLLLAGVLALFANSRLSYESNDRLARIQENGRFALALMTRDLRAAGYWGCAKRIAAKPLENVLASPTTLLRNFNVPVQGFNASGTTWAPNLIDELTTDAPTPGSDVLVIRGPKPDASPQTVQTSMASPTSDLVVYKPGSSGGIQSGDIAIAASCDQATVFHVTSYTPGGGATDTIAHGTASGSLNSTATLENRFYAETAEVYPVQTTIYFVDSGPNGNSLYRRTGSASPEEIVEGVDSFQVQFGLDTNGDRLADTYENASATTNWDQVVSVRLGLLVRSLD